jgi:hypothetical protein
MRDAHNAKRPSERAFVLQFEPVDCPRGRLRGRVEIVASGEAMRFASMKQLNKFLVEALRRPADETVV